MEDIWAEVTTIKQNTSVVYYFHTIGGASVQYTFKGILH
jgi:hypothetical protein